MSLLLTMKRFMRETETEGSKGKRSGSVSSRNARDRIVKGENVTSSNVKNCSTSNINANSKNVKTRNVKSKNVKTKNVNRENVNKKSEINRNSNVEDKHDRLNIHRLHAISKEIK